MCELGAAALVTALIVTALVLTALIVTTLVFVAESLFFCQSLCVVISPRLLEMSLPLLLLVVPLSLFLGDALTLTLIFFAIPSSLNIATLLRFTGFLLTPLLGPLGFKASLSLVAFRLPTLLFVVHQRISCLREAWSH